MISWVSLLTVAVNKKYLIAIIVVLLIAAAAGVYFLFFAPKENPVTVSKLTEFAKCLSKNQVVMYGAYWCPHCQQQKKDFGDAFKYVKYVECTENEKLCLSKKVDGYPTWTFKNGDRIRGEASFTDLAKKSSCPAPK